MTDSVKLDKIDRKILFELDRNCRVPATVLARKVKRSRQAVEYRINELVKKKVILGFNTYFNFEKLGYNIQRVFLRIKNIPSEKKEMISYLRSLPFVFWMAECYGSWDVVFTVFYRKDSEFHELKNSIFSRFANIVIDQYADLLIDARQYPKMFFTGEIARPYSFGGDVSEPDIDVVDKAIMGVLVREANLSVIEIARRIKSTPKIVRTRMKKLEDDGLIIHYFISVDLSKIGMEQHKALVRLDRYSKKDESRLIEYLSKIPNTSFYVKTLWHVELEFIIDNYVDYYKLIDDLKSEFVDVIKTVESMFVIRSEITSGFDRLLKGDPAAITSETITSRSG
jgi:DNA-binding Lrp family transcriptional regulator